MKHYILIFLIILLFKQADNPIVGKRKIESYDAIDKIKNSPAYMFGNESTREIIDKQFEEILANGQYNFDKDTLIYTDNQGATIINRRALWSIEEKIITIKEIDRPFARQAFVHFLSGDSLVMSPVIRGEIGTSQIIFSKLE